MEKKLRQLPRFHNRLWLYPKVVYSGSLDTQSDKRLQCPHASGTQTGRGKVCPYSRVFFWLHIRWIFQGLNQPGTHRSCAPGNSTTLVHRAQRPLQSLFKFSRCSFYRQSVEPGLVKLKGIH